MAEQENIPLLQGVRVVELGQFLAGPFGGVILGDMGAEVVKVEVPGRGDDGRRMGQPFDGGDALIFRDINRGKKSVAIDFQTPEGLEQLVRLIATADIVISNLRPGVVERFGIDGATLIQRFPRLVYCDLAASGHQGPMRLQPGYEPLAQAFSGLSSINGPLDGPPTRTGPSVVDLGSGMWIAISALAALRRRDMTGEGSTIRLSLLETALAWIGADVSGYLNEGRVPRRRGNAQPLLVPYDTFDTLDGPLCIAVGNDRMFDAFARSLGHAEWAAPGRYQTNATRLAHKAELAGQISALLKESPRDYWVHKLQGAGVPCSVVNTIPEMLESAQAQSLGMLTISGQTHRQSMGLPFTVNGIRPGSLAEAPVLGQHNAEIFGTPASSM